MALKRVLKDLPLLFGESIQQNKKTFGLTLLALALRYQFKKKKNDYARIALIGNKKQTGTNSRRQKVDLVDLVSRLSYILRTAMPSIWCRETVSALLLASVLLLRTYMTLRITDIIGEFVRALSSRDWVNLKRITSLFTLIGIPLAVLNASLKFFTQALRMQIREKLTLKVHDLYTKNMNYYKANRVGVEKFEHADQLIAEDIEKFSDTLSDVYSNFLKPLVDFVSFSLQLRSWLGSRGPLTMYSWFCIASWISSLVLPSYGRLAIESQQLEGKFRSLHARLIGSSEMIAFNGGEKPEKNIIDTAFEKIKNHEWYSRLRQFASNIIMGYLNKYAASNVGFIVVILPVLFNERNFDKASASDIASYYVECTRIMQGQAEAVLNLFELSKQIGTLTGLTFRVWNLIHRLEHPEQLKLPTETDNPPKIVPSESLSFENVSIYKPDGSLLLKHLTFSIPPGTRVIITGENGVGKSSLFRVLRGLWPLSVGTISTPHRNSLHSFYFLSQDNFVPVGTLREIIIYPQLLEDMKKEGKTDDDLREVLRWSHLEKLKVRGVVPDMDTQLDWQTDLSPGQKQRMAFARLLYHRPKYALLDDCTNGVAPEVEVDLYERCKTLNITVFSISHKKDLRRLHDYELRCDSDGGWKWIKIDEKAEPEDK